MIQVGFAQAPAIEWQKCFGGTGDDYAQSIHQTTDGGYIVAGYTTSNNDDVTGNHGNYDHWIVKFSTTGTIEWQNSLGGTASDEAYNLQQTSDGGYIVAGYTISNDGDVTGFYGVIDAWIVKLSTSGSIEWQKTLGGTDDDGASFIRQTTDGGYVVAGGTWSNDNDVTGNHGESDFWIVKLSSTGNIQWQKTYGGDGIENANSIQQTTDGGFIAVGFTNSNNGDVTGNHGGVDYWVLKLSATGTIQWQKTLGGTGDEYANSVQQTTDGGFIISGITDSNDGDISGNHGNNEVWIIKLSATGNIEWQKALGGTGGENAICIQQTITDGGYILSGNTTSNDGDITGFHGGSSSDYWIVKLLNSGNILWQKTLGGTLNDSASSIVQTLDGGYIIGGFTNSNDGDIIGNHGGYDFWIVKLGSDVFNTNDFSESAIKVFPNPTTTTLTLQNPNNLIIDKIIITDLTGKTLQQQVQSTNQINVEQLAKVCIYCKLFRGRKSW